MARLNLSYFEPSDDFYFTETSQIAPEFREDFAQFFEDLINRLNFLGGSYSPETGEGRFPFYHTMRLYNFSPDQILTNYVSGTSYEFDMSVQGNDVQFSADGSTLTTFQDVIDLIQANTNSTVTYLPSKNNIDHRFRLRSNTEGRASQPSGGGQGGGGGTTAITSRIEVRKLANQNYNLTDSTSQDDQFATVTAPLPAHDGSQVLTKAPNNGSPVFEFKQGPTKKMAVRGSDAQTYQQLVDTINSQFSTVQAYYRNDAPYKNQIMIVFAIPDGEEASKYDWIAEGIKVQPNITSFEPLTTNSEVIHLLEETVAGGPNLQTVLAYSKRGNDSGWTAFIPILSTAGDTKTTIAEDSAQAPTLQKITDETPKEAGISISDVAGSNGEAIPEESTSASAVGASLSTSVGSRADRYESLKNGDTTPSDTETVFQNATGNVSNTGYAPGALDNNGNVQDESLLTPAQKSSRIEQPTKFSN